MSVPVKENWLHTAMRPEVMRRSRRLALLVGTILILVNYADRVVTGAIVPMDYVKMLMTYFVPYGVTTYASVSAIRDHGRETDHEEM